MPTDDKSIDTSVDETSTDESVEDVPLEEVEVDLKDIESEESDEEEESEDVEEDAEAEQSDAPEESEEDKQKRFNDEMAQRRIAAKEERILTQKQQQQEYVNEAEDEKDLALRQLQVDAYDNKVESNTNKLTNGYERALAEFEILRDPSPEIQAEVDAAIDAFQAMYVTIDDYENPVEVKGDLYKYLQNKADSIKRLSSLGARQQSNDKARSKANTFVPPSRTPKEVKEDPDLKAFDEEAKK